MVSMLAGSSCSSPLVHLAPERSLNHRTVLIGKDL